MSKIGFINDIVRGVEKLAQKETNAQPVASGAGNPTVDSLLKRAFIFLEDNDWQSANEYCEKVLDMDPENCKAYLGKLMAETHCNTESSIAGLETPIDGKNNYLKVLRYANPELKDRMEEYAKRINERVLEIEQEKKRREAERLERERIYAGANNLAHSANSSADFKKAAELFSKVAGFFEDAQEKMDSCLKTAALIDSYGHLVFMFDTSTQCDMSIKLDGKELIKGLKGMNESVRFDCVPGEHTAEMTFLVDKGGNVSFTIETGRTTVIRITRKLFGYRLSASDPINDANA